MDTLGRAWLLYYARKTVASIDGSTRAFFTPGHGLDLGNPIAGGASGAQVWIAGTRDLGVFDGNKFQNIRAADGQHFDNASAVIPTEHDGLWLKVPKGIIQIPEEELVAFSHDHLHAVDYRSFDATTDFDTQLAPPRPSASDTGAVLSSDGKLWFAVFGGVAMIGSEASRQERSAASRLDHCFVCKWPDLYDIP